MARAKPPTWNGVPIPYGASLESLRAALRSPGPTAWAAFRALVETPGRKVLDLLSECARHPDPHFRRAAVEAIGLHDDGRSLPNIILRALQDSKGLVVRAACRSAARLELTEAHDAVLRLVKANEEATRFDALRALAALWDPADFSIILDRFSRDPSDRVRKQAAWVLQEHVGPKEWKTLFTVWSQDPLPRHRVWSCRLAERFGDSAILADLARLEQDADGHVRSAARRAILHINTRR